MPKTLIRIQISRVRLHGLQSGHYSSICHLSTLLSIQCTEQTIFSVFQPVCVCLFSYALSNNYTSNFHQILYACQKCPRFYAYYLWDKLEVRKWILKVCEFQIW